MPLQDQLVEFARKEKLNMYLLAHNVFVQDHTRFHSDIDTSVGVTAHTPTFMLPSVKLVRGTPTAQGGQARVMGNAMCDLYPRSKKVKFPVSL